MIESALMYPMLVLSIGYLVLGITGFGSALVIVPLLANYWPLPEVVALSILLDIPASLLHGGLNLQRVQWKELRRLLPSMAVGTVFGLWLLGGFDKHWPLFALGCYVAFVGIRTLLPQSTKTRRPAAAWAHLAGTLVGLIEVMFATAGPVVVVWLRLRLQDHAEVRATIPLVMLIAAAVAIVVLWGSGQVDADVVISRWLYGIPVALVGVLLGNRLAARIPPKIMGRLLALLLTASGLSLMQHVFV